MPKLREVNRRLYLEQFLGFRCAGDVLNAVGPMKEGPVAISQAVALFRAIRPEVMRKPNEYQLVELCAGNAIASVLAIHTLPLKHAFAYNAREPKLAEFKQVKRFDFLPDRPFGSKMHTPTILVVRRGHGDCVWDAFQFLKDDPNVKMLAMILPWHVERDVFPMEDVDIRSIRDRHIIGEDKVVLTATRT